MNPKNTLTSSDSEQPQQATPAQPQPQQVQKPTWQQEAAASIKPAAGMPASATAPVVSQGPKRKHLLVALSLVGAVVILGGASAAAYFGYVLPNQPQNILNAALVNEFTPGKVKTESFHGTVTASEKDSEAITGEFKGSIDKNGPFEITAKAKISTVNATLDLRSADAKSFYIRLGGLDALANPDAGDDSAIAPYGPILAAIDDQWIEISEDFLKESGTGVDTSKGLKLSDADMKKVADAYKEHQFLVVKEKLADQKIAGKQSHHLRIVIDKQALKGFASSVKAANIDAFDITTDQLKDFNKSVDETDFAKNPVDVWVSEADKLINQVSFTGKDDSGTTSIVVTVDDWNRAVKVDKPSDAKLVDELLIELYSGAGVTTESLMELQPSQQSDAGISL